MESGKALGCEHDETVSSCESCLFVLGEFNAIDYHLARMAHPITVGHARKEGCVNAFEFYFAYLAQTAEATNASIFGA